MDPLSSLLDSINQAASSRSPSDEDVLAHASTIIAPSEQVASQRTTTADERVRLREEGPAHEANARRVLDLTDQLSALTNQHQEAQAAAAFNAERARLAEWDAEVRSDWSSRISLGPATTSPQSWPRPTRK